jgi:lycopene cyclase-like protein
VSSAVDVLVAGAGPTGTALAAELSARGLRVLLVDATDGAPWRATYGAWADELDGAGDGSPAAAALALPSTRRWPGVSVADDDGSRFLPRGYVRLDTPALQAALTERADAAGVERTARAVTGAEHLATGSRVALRDGREVGAALVVDATGHSGTLVGRPPVRGPRAVQSAYGVVVDLPGPPVPSGGPVLMDFSAAHLPEPERGADPTFLYAFPLGGDRWFVEETSLARRPALPQAVLARRLDLRLAASGAAPGPRREVEHVRIPMDTPLPCAGQRVVAVGAAASAVHPATGYLLAAALRSAPPVAEAVVRGLEVPGGDPERAAARAWEVLWPPDRVRVRRLHTFGLEALLGMDAPTTRAFFRTFFAGRPHEWADYLSGRQSLPATLATMARLYAAAPPSVRGHLRGAALGPHGLLLARALSGALPTDPAPPGRRDEQSPRAMPLDDM